jgi:hypothetical protein
MNQKNIIILINSEKEEFETWGSLTELADNHSDIIHSSIKNKKYPFTYKGYDFIRVPWREKNDKLK